LAFRALALTERGAGEAELIIRLTKHGATLTKGGGTVNTKPRSVGATWFPPRATMPPRWGLRRSGLGSRAINMPPTELEHPSANAFPPERGDFGLQVSDLPFAGIVAAMG